MQTPPAFEEEVWIGGAVLNQINDNRFDLNDWLSFGDVANNPEVAPAILLSKPFGFEYPKSVAGLVCQLKKADVSQNSLIALLSVAAETKDAEKPMHVVVGTPMRGIAGQGEERRQHLAIWEIEPLAVQRLALVTKALNLCEKWGDGEGKKEIFKLTDEIIEAAKAWTKEARIGWCRIMENRPEVTQRRDGESPLHAFRGKKVALLGCGAIGGCVAEHLARTGVEHITLMDNGQVHPGILVRQNFRNEDIGAWKADALKDRLLAINPALNCEASKENVYQDLLANTEWIEQFDIVIDATASLRVRTKLEELKQGSAITAMAASLMVSSRAEHAAMAASPPEYTGATLDTLRKLGLSVMNRDHLSVYKNAFWATESDRQLFQPEPGCSDPTFVGSSADVGVLAGKMLNKLAELLSSSGEEAYGVLFSRDSTENYDYLFAYQPDILIQTGNGVDVRLTQHAWRDIKGWINSGARERGPLVETGGLLFGEFNDVVNVLWVNEVIGPPSDSEFSEAEFVCGTSGSQEINQEKKKRTGNSVKFIGTWHSHPISPGQPSQ
ncbi:ThiF family adenylyltransferase [Solemya velesiana gill symbiont]|nr:ThiF family adenylyltransferase [Solemya velesiana gill symbiont]